MKVGDVYKHTNNTYYTYFFITKIEGNLVYSDIYTKTFKLHKSHHLVTKGYFTLDLISKPPIKEIDKILAKAL